MHEDLGLEFVILLLLLIAAFVFAKKSSRHGNHRPHVTIHPKVTEARKDDLSPDPVRTILKGMAYVVDGDTITVKKTQIRLFGIDAPEMDHPHGEKAKWALVSLCKGQIVSAEVTGTDDYGRTVARCWLDDGRDLSAEMVKLGFALDWKKFSGGQYRSLEVPGVRKKLWLADARQKGNMAVWEKYNARRLGISGTSPPPEANSAPPRSSP